MVVCLPPQHPSTPLVFIANDNLVAHVPLMIESTGELRVMLPNAIHNKIVVVRAIFKWKVQLENVTVNA